MRLRLLVVVTFSLLFAVSIIGCIGSNEQTKVESIPTTVIPTPTKIPDPEETLYYYKFYFNNVLTESLYNMLSSNIKKKMTEDEVHNIVYAYAEHGIKIYKYEVLRKRVNKNTATLNVKITWSIQGYRQTKEYVLHFVFENGEWKLDEPLIRP